MSALRLAIVAGEPSGDMLGADLVRALIEETGTRPDLIGVGGDLLIAEGLESLFDYSELSIIGFSAVIAQLPRLIARINQTADAIIAANPDCLVIVDSPDFSHRVARKVRKALPNLKIINYVCPTVWAWKPERAAAMRGYVDHVLSIFPFEPEIVERLGGPPLTYVGHRLMDDPGLAGARRTQLSRRRSGPGGAQPLCLILPGSRRSEVAALADDFGEAARRLSKFNPDMRFALLAGSRVERQIRDKVLEWDFQCRVLSGEEAKWQLFGAADVAIAASGTVLLELALAGVPHMSCYRLDPIARMLLGMVTTWTGALPNMISGHPTVSEFYDNYVRAERLARLADQLARPGLHREAMISDFDLVWDRMKTSEPASKLAARTLLSVVGI